jgi:hypothetical protein
MGLCHQMTILEACKIIKLSLVQLHVILKFLGCLDKEKIVKRVSASL